MIQIEYQVVFARPPVSSPFAPFVVQSMTTETLLSP
jgi:hypothetical protein